MDAKIVEYVKNPDANCVDEEDSGTTSDHPKLRDAYAALRTLQLYGLQHGFEEFQDCADRLEELPMKKSQEAIKQNKITDFLQK